MTPESEVVNQIKWDDVRHRRSNLLRYADELINKCEDMGNDASSLRQYRQALRDIPQTCLNPDDVVWPEKPTI
ncbi:hypothetical protein HC752_21445 [Vibrio sp. S9_S30]|uniref:phage tail assembly chaperone n=1 Tax=Vibrio sp. S9_S30 TaxID=2720226 RepID=UPI001680B2AF|nr:phage tail assembly chaperone [Vibrio sp. S9_S30]MBD1559511.1 hypothetical protein [Vibrio sp. S9_S30]